MSENERVLVDGRHALRDLLDVEKTRRLLEHFSEATGIATALFSSADLGPLMTTGKQGSCRAVHRAIPPSWLFGYDVDLLPTSPSDDSFEPLLHRCSCGLVDVSTPLVVDGVPLGHIIAGHILLQSPDQDQATDLGRDAGFGPETRAAVPAVSEERLEEFLAFLSTMVRTLAEQGLARIRHLRAAQRLAESEAQLRTLSDNLPGGLVYQINSGRDGTKRRFTYLSAGVERLHGISVAEGLENADVIYGQVIEEDRHLVAEMEAEATVSMTPFSAEVRVRLPGGETCSRLFTSAPRRLSNGDLVWDGVELDVTERRRVEAALSENQTLLALFIEHSPILAYIKEVSQDESRVVHASESFEELIGLRGREILGKTMHELFPAEFAAKIIADDWAVITRGEVLRVEENFDARSFATIKFPIVQGAKTLLAGYTIDITDRVRTEAALRLSEAQLRANLEVTPNVAVQWYDEEGRILYWNPASEAIYGWKASEALGKTLDALIQTQEEAAEFRQILVGIHQTGKPFGPYEAHTHHKDGREGWVLATTFGIPMGEGKTGFVCMDVDISARKQAEAALQRNEQRLSFALAATSDAIWEWDYVTGRTSYSSRWFEMLGYEDRAFEMTFEAWKALCHPDDLPSTVDAIDAVVEHPSSPGYAAEFRMRHRDGSWRWILGRGNVVRRDEQGRALLLSGTNTDITTRKRAEEEKSHLQAQLLQAQKMESVGRLAGGVAHDFNNMLGVILGYVDVALAQVDVSLPLRECLIEIRQAAERSAELNRQLLAFARKQTILPRVLDLNATVEGMIKMLQRLIGEEIELVWRPGEGLWPVKMDPTQIDQVLANLCVNARDAIAGIGRVTIDTSRGTLDEAFCAEHQAFSPGEYVVLTVSDTGCGMDDEMLAHMFEPFFTTKALGKGTGLGLATTYGIVKQNSGFIDVDSAPGLGTTIRIYLPPHLMSGAPVPAGAAAPPMARGHETILVVEDEPAILRVATRALRQLGYAVLPAQTPGEAIRVAREHGGGIHLLLTDVIMPEMNGRVLAATLQARDPRIKCLFMSGYPADVIAHRGILDEGVEFLQKPFSAADLTRRIRAILDGQ